MISVTGDEVVRQSAGQPPSPWWQVLRLVLVLGWVAWAALAWWTAPRESTAAQARADSAESRLTSYEWGDAWNTTGFTVALRSGLESTGGPGPILLWQTRDGRQHYAYVDNSATDRESQSIDAELQAAAPDGAPVIPFTAVRMALGIAGVVLVLWALVSAAEPVTGTRWFWFWLATGVPLGLGMLWWLARERPWSSRAPVRPNRLKWWAGLGLSVLAGFAISLVLGALRGVLGESVVPNSR